MEYSKQIQNVIESLDPFATETEILQYEQPNPFYLPTEGSGLKYTKTKFLADAYKNVHILCLCDDFEITADNKNRIQLFYQADSEISELKGQSKFVTLIRGPFSLVHLQTIRSGLVPVDKQLLNYFNNDCLELADKEIVYLMLETRESNVKSWIKLYESENNLDKFIEQKIFASYYRLDDKKLNDNILSLIGRVGDFKYWQDERNCALSIDNAFSERKFNLSFFQKWNLPIEEIEKELQKLLQNFSENKSKAKSDNPAYPVQITDSTIIEPKEDPLKMSTYVDGSKRDNKSFFGIVKTDELVIKKETVQELLVNHSLSEKEKYYLLCNLLASKNYCHYVLNNKKVLDANKDLMEKYKPVIRYLMGYSWISLYMEESIRKTKTKELDRFVFDINTAAALPVFPFVSNSPHLNPYFSCMISDVSLNCNQNMCGVKNTIEYQNGIVNLEEFRTRMNIFISGNQTINLLNGANWDHMAVTGGIMAAIMPKTNPLMALFKKTADPKIPMSDKELNRFFQEYYSKSDIDIACNNTNILDFIEHVKHLKTIVQTNLGQNKNNAIQIIPNKSLAIFINSTLLKEKCDREEIPFKYEYIIENKNKRAVKFYFYELYLEQKKKSNGKNRAILGEKINDDEYFEIIDYCEFDKTVIIINNNEFEKEHIENRSPESNSGIEMIYFIKEKDRIPTITEEDDFETDCKVNNLPFQEQSQKSGPIIFVKFSETLKYKITSKYLKHPFEIFRITDVEFFSCVSRFHLPCVRSYYNGANCYLLPSAITAYQTLTNIDFKYFVGSHDPISIIDKYRKRGYGTILNKTEINQYLSYVMAAENYKKAYGISNTSDIKNIIGNLDAEHCFFKPRKTIPEDFPVDPDIKPTDYNKSNLTYVVSEADILKHYKKKYSKYSSEFIGKRTINSKGQIEPIKKWMIDASYDLLN